MDEMDEIIGEFLAESAENLDRLDTDFVALEQDPASAEILGSIFRTIHTIKGTSRFLGFANLEGVAHVAENLLAELRAGTQILTPDTTTVLLRAVDAIRSMLGAIAETQADGTDGFAALKADLEAFLVEADRPTLPTSGIVSLAGATVAGLVAAATPSQASEPLVADAGPVEAGPVEDGDEAGEAGSGPVPGAAVEAALAVASSLTPDPAPARAPAVADTTIRVDVGLLDALMNLVSELVLARNQILQHTGRVGDPDLHGVTQRLNAITSELQEGVMKTRMQPVSTVWGKLPRVVRDLALQCGKQVRLEMEGKETELDKTVLEAIKDPLTHMVRNSIDHGIELPELRRERGKPVEGVLRLRAAHEGGQVTIEIVDDGGGIDPARIRSKAVERGLLGADAAHRISDHDALMMIFHPGFSTAEQVTAVSGRGVGMDVVKTNIEAIGGALDVQSQVGVGTTFTVRIPLTLAIVPALVVGVGMQRYAIPQVSLVELVRLDGAQVAAIERIGDARVYRLRGELVPLVTLRDVLACPQPVDQSADAVNIAILQADGVRFGLVVDRIADTEEIVVKPLGRLIGTSGVFAGTTIMGDGAVALILDVPGLARRARLLGDATATTSATALTGGSAPSPGDRRSERMLLLLCAVGLQRVAVPVGLINRIEEIPAASVERVGVHEVVQYRGGLLQLVRVADHVPAGWDGYGGPTEMLQAVVCGVDGRTVGLVVDEILDIVEAESTTLDGGRGQLIGGIACSGVIGRRVTDLIDVRALLANVEPAFTDVPTNEPAALTAAWG